MNKNSKLKKKLKINFEKHKKICSEMKFHGNRWKIKQVMTVSNFE